DHHMKITHVMRGSEFLSSTPKHKLLYEAFGWDVPTYVHLPLILSPDGGKLSKRKGAAYFEDFVEEGFLPKALINFLALLGFAPPDNREIFTLDELIEIFNIEGLSKSPSTFDMQKLKWMNGEYIKNMPLDEFCEMAAPYTKNAAAAVMAQGRISTLGEIAEMLDFVDNLPDYDIELFANKKNKSTAETSKDMLIKLLPEIETFCAEQWQTESLSAFLKDFAQKQDVKPAIVMWPVRTALSGKETSPGGATDLLVVLGKDESIARIKTALQKLG
ncbi:MAG: glutamate--tRNA ligase family protein, partial [Defluviitaleaceae bacterium]|nr:glutamate--tRNA ligase family protein [Defluviitaleaceae bacterium]